MLLSLATRWGTAVALGVLGTLLEARIDPDASDWSPLFVPFVLIFILAQAAFAMAWLWREPMPARTLVGRLPSLLVAGVLEMVPILLAVFAMLGLSAVGHWMGLAIGALLLLWVMARFLPLGPVVLLSKLGPGSALGATWRHSRGTALVGGTSLLAGALFLTLLERGGQMEPTGPLALALMVFSLSLFGGLSAWSYRAGSCVLVDGAMIELDTESPLEPDDTPTHISGITPAASEVEWEPERS